jgi:ParB-like chromosome segregation protein Spo0J
MEKIRIDDIQLGPRLREDLGDLEELARSIARHGLLHPPVLSRDKRLIAGMRRVRACQLLGWTEIEVRWIDELPEDERLALELEENLRRKDLTAYERSKGVMQQAEAVASRLSREAQATAENPLDAHENPLPGRPPKPDADAKVAAEIGVSQSALSLAKQHVAAVEKYPELREMTQRGALDTAKEWDSLIEDAREQRRETWRVPAAEWQAEDQEQAPSTTPATARLCRPADPDPFWRRATQNLSAFLTKTEKIVRVRNEVSIWTRTARQQYLHKLRRAQERVTILIGEIEQIDTTNASEHAPGQPHAEEGERSDPAPDELCNAGSPADKVTQAPDGVRPAPEPERPDRQDGSTDAVEPTAPLRDEPPGHARDFDAGRDTFIDRVKTL